jgi:hypothetical protein
MCGGILAVQLVTISVAGYSFVRLRYPGQNLLFSGFLLQLLLIPSLLIVPNLATLVSLRLYDSLLGIMAPPESWGEWLEAAKKLTKPDGERGGINFPGTYDYCGWLTSAFVMQNGGQYYNHDYGGEVYYNAPSTMGAITLLDTLVNKAKVMPPGVSDANACKSAFFAGRLGMMLLSTGSAGDTFGQNEPSRCGRCGTESDRGSPCRRQDRTGSVEVRGSLVGNELLYLRQIVGRLARREIAGKTAPLAGNLRADQPVDQCPRGGLPLRRVAFRQDQQSTSDRSGVAYAIPRASREADRSRRLARKLALRDLSDHAARRERKTRHRAQLTIRCVIESRGGVRKVW